ncbi:MAG: GntR family transcriptional regulator [Chloroflexi bacterium]|nr:GntR family transcriptional regulator [Chloroflexota bacterium]
MQSVVFEPRLYQPLYQDAYHALRDAILTGQFAPGQRLVEAELARQMAISRAPIREAIRKLEQDGLVKYIPRRGVVVAELSSEEVRDLYDIRAHLEGLAVRMLVAHLTSEDVAVLEGLIQRMFECATRDDLRGLIAADVEFHAHICRLSGSKRLYRLWESLNPQCWTLLTSLKATEYTLDQIAERHRPVLAALKSGDAGLCEAVISRHVTELADHVLAHLVPPDGLPVEVTR